MLKVEFNTELSFKLCMYEIWMNGNKIRNQRWQVMKRRQRFYGKTRIIILPATEQKEIRERIISVNLFTIKILIMEKFALLARVEAKPGKETEVFEFLKSALPLAQEEPDTVRW